MAIQTGDNNWAVAKYIVDPTAGQGDFPTITLAMASASSGDVIAVRQGTYTEDFTIPAGVTLTTMGGSQLTPTVTIVGKVTMTEAGTSTIYGIRLQTNGDYCLVNSGSNAAIINFISCNISCSDNDGINFTNSNSSSSISFRQCITDLGTTGIKLFAYTGAGSIGINYTRCKNSGSSTTQSTFAGTGALTVEFSTISIPILFSGTGGLLNVNKTTFNTSSTNTTAITLNNTTATGSGIVNCDIASGTASAISYGVNHTGSIERVRIESSNANAITETGAATLKFSDLTFNSSSTVNITTLTPLNQRDGYTRSYNLGIGVAPSTTAGITFDASNYMDAYEVGSFTPTVAGTGTPTYVNQIGSYIKIGRLVVATVTCNWSAISGPAGSLQIGGLPFTIANVASALPSCTWGSFGANVPLTAGTAPIFKGSVNTTIGTCFGYDAVAGGMTAVTKGSGAGGVFFTLTYIASS